MEVVLTHGKMLPLNVTATAPLRHRTVGAPGNDFDSSDFPASQNDEPLHDLAARFAEKMASVE